MSHKYNTPPAINLIQDVYDDPPVSGYKNLSLHIPIGKLAALWNQKKRQQAAKSIGPQPTKPVASSWHKQGAVGNDFVPPRAFTRVGPLNVPSAVPASLASPPNHFRSAAARLKLYIGFAAFRLRRMGWGVILALRTRLQRLFAAMASLLAAIASLGLFRNLHWRTKKYVASKGKLTDWNGITATRVRRYGLPAIAALFVIMVVAQMWQLATPNAGQKGHRRAVTASSTAGTTSAQSKAPAASQTNLTNPTPSALANIPAANAAGNSPAAGSSGSGILQSTTGGTSGIVGGRGGGSQIPAVTPPATGGAGGSGGAINPTVPPVPGVTQPYTVTVPAQTIQAGGKPVIGTSPVGVTLN